MKNAKTSPMATRTGLKELIESQIKVTMREARFCIPCTVLSVNKNSVNVKPLITTKYSSEKFYEYSEYQEVPVGILSANRGIASINMPIKAGDVGILYFAERDPSNLLLSDASKIVDPDTREPISLATYGYSIMYFGEIFTDANDFTIDTNDVIVKNDKSFHIYKPDGTHIIKNSNGTIKISPNGVHTISNSGTTVTIDIGSMDISAPSGVTINGAQVTGGGDVITAGGVSLDQLKSDFDKHIHSGVASGSTNTKGPTIP